jgi:hypothetical protein
MAQMCNVFSVRLPQIPMLSATEFLPWVIRCAITDMEQCHVTMAGANVCYIGYVATYDFSASRANFAQVLTIS